MVGRLFAQTTAFFVISWFRTPAFVLCMICRSHFLPLSRCLALIRDQMFGFGVQRPPMITLSAHLWLYLVLFFYYRDSYVYLHKLIVSWINYFSVQYRKNALSLKSNMNLPINNCFANSSYGRFTFFLGTQIIAKPMGIKFFYYAWLPVSSKYVYLGVESLGRISGLVCPVVVFWMTVVRCIP